MSKEAQEYFKKEWGPAFIGATLSHEKGLLQLSMKDIHETMQSYAEHYHKGKVESYTSGNAADDQNKFYIKAGHNAYFGEGFNYGIQALREHLLKEKE